MYIFRTKETHELYEEHKRNGQLEHICRLCEAETLHEFTHWRIVNNRFPYDRICQLHHMLIPKRHIIEHELSDAEKEELLLIKHTHVNETYVFVLEALPQYKSIPSHFHLHLVIPKEE